MEPARAGMDPAREGVWAPVLGIMNSGEGISHSLAVDSAVAVVVVVDAALGGGLTRSVTIISNVNIYS